MQGGDIVEQFKVNIERRPAYLVVKEITDGSFGIEDHEIFYEGINVRNYNNHTVSF